MPVVSMQCEDENQIWLQAVNSRLASRHPTRLSTYSDAFHPGTGPDSASVGRVKSRSFIDLYCDAKGAGLPAR